MRRSYGTQLVAPIYTPEINFGITKCVKPTALLIYQSNINTNG